MTSTFAHVLESAEGNSHEVTTYVDKATPAGHFAAISNNADNDKVIYLMEGEKDAVEAVVKGYVLMVFDENDGLEANGFAQDSLKAETPLGRVRRYSGKTESFKSVFAQMV